jgi:hypothetical protein
VTLTTFATAAAPISLDDLVASAGLQTRLDRKYLLTAADLDVVTDRLAGEPDRGLAVLDIAGRRTFGYRSTYFDTPDLRAYRSAGRGRRRRFKVPAPANTSTRAPPGWRSRPADRAAARSSSGSRTSATLAGSARPAPMRSPCCSPGRASPTWPWRH